MNDRIKTEDGLRYMHKIDLCKYFNNMSKTEIYAILNEISRERKKTNERGIYQGRGRHHAFRKNDAHIAQNNQGKFRDRNG